MAKIIEQIIVVKFSTIVKDTDNKAKDVVDEDLIAQLEQIVQELAPDAVVEVIKE